MKLSKAATKKVQQKKPPKKLSPKIVQNISSPYNLLRHGIKKDQSADWPATENLLSV